MAPTPPPELTATRFDFGDFFDRYWRRWPLHVSGGAREFVDTPWVPSDFERAHALASSADGEIRERAGSVTFIERVSDFDPTLQKRADELGPRFGAPTAWFDAVRTQGSEPEGIGAHFDHSDNFVLQQSGAKDWTLASPDHIDPDAVKRRILNAPDVGAQELPESNLITVELAPGDLLYIPLLWLHNGLASESSLSLSIVCPATSLASEAARLAWSAMLERGLGAQVIPAAHDGLSDAERADRRARLDEAASVLLTRVAKDLGAENAPTD